MQLLQHHASPSPLAAPAGRCHAAPQQQGTALLLSTTKLHPACPPLAPNRRIAGRIRSAVRSVATERLPPSGSSSNSSVVLGSYDEAVFEPSRDLRELAAAQLHSLFQVLRRISSPASSSSSSASHSSCKACVYARRADSLDAPQMKLQRVACCTSAQQQPHSSSSFGFSSSGGGGSGSSPGSNNSFEELDEILTLHRAAWEPNGSSSSGSTGCETEALLINEEVVLLPSSNLLVLPLAEAGVLVGLLVVEVRSKPGSPPPYQPQPLGQQQQQGQPVWELPPVLGLSEDVLWALRMSVPPLAKACAMDLRTALAGAQQEARQRLARSLLLEARGPLKVLGTFGSMLSPRLRTGQVGGAGEPESDMADGMLLQGQRLADVVAQLEAALRPAPGRAARLPALSSSSSSGGGGGASWGAAQQQQQQQQRPPSWREPLALPGASDDGNMSDEDDSWALADGPQQQAQVVSGSATAAAGGGAAEVQVLPPQQQQQQAASGSSKHKLLGPGAAAATMTQQQPVDVVCVPGLHTALESSSRDIRWSSVDAPVPKQPAAAAAANSSTSTSAYAAAAATGTIDAVSTIDLEPLAPEAVINSSSSVSSSSVSSSPVRAVHAALMPRRSAAGASQQQQQQQQQAKRPAQQRGSCNVVDVLSQLLSAAAGLAAASGINLIVNDPLSLDTHHNNSTAASAAAAASSSSTALVLLPRPVRPLLAGVAGNVARRVLGYCVDVALQCTPRGGQLCVTARASSGGVEVSLMHTGHAQPDRLHTTTASMDAAALGGPAAAAAAPAAAAAASGPAGSLVMRKNKRQSGRKRKQQQAPAAAATTPSSSSASSSSSSRWSTGLQELSSSSSSGLRGGSSLITLDFARQILQSIGGRLSLTYPYHFINALTGQLEVGSNIEVWLPAPAAAATAAS